jgi:hypothetical protein
MCSPTLILSKLLSLQLFFVEKVAQKVIQKCDFEKMPKKTIVQWAKIRPIWSPCFGFHVGRVLFTTQEQRVVGCHKTLF